MENSILRQLADEAFQADGNGSTILEYNSEAIATYLGVAETDAQAVLTAIETVLDENPQTLEVITWDAESWEGFVSMVEEKVDAQTPPKKALFGRKASSGTPTPATVEVSTNAQPAANTTDNDKALKAKLDIFMVKIGRPLNYHPRDNRDGTPGERDKILAEALKLHKSKGLKAAEDCIREAVNNGAGYMKDRNVVLNGIKSRGWTTAAPGKNIPTDYEQHILGNEDFGLIVNRYQAGHTIEDLLDALDIVQVAHPNGRAINSAAQAPRKALFGKSPA